MDRQFGVFEDGLEFIGESGFYDPDIVAFESTDLDVSVYMPLEPADVPLQQRIGYPVYVVKTQSFAIEPATSTMSNAQASGFVSNDFVPVSLLTDGEIYPQSTFIKTPNLTELTTSQLNADSCYIIEAEGLKETYFK